MKDLIDLILPAVLFLSTSLGFTYGLALLVIKLVNRKRYE